MSPFRRWFAIAFSVFILTFACGLFRIAWTPKVYVATAQIAGTARGPIDQLWVANNPNRPLEEDTAPSEMEIIQSEDVLTPIIRDLELDKKWAARIPTSDPLAYLRSHLKLEWNAGTNSIKISFFSDVPTEAANIANAIADRYKIMRDMEQDQITNRFQESLRVQIAQQEKVVADALASVQQTKDNQLGGTESTEKAYADLDKMKADLLTAQEDYDARQVLWKRLADLPDKEFMDTLHGLGRQQKTHDDGADLPLQVASLKRSMQSDRDMAQARVIVLQTQVETLETKEAGDPHLRAVIETRRKFDQAKALLDVLNVRLRQDQANAAVSQRPVRILTRAEAPSHPIQPNVPLDLVLSVIAGMMLGVFAASFIELLLWLRR